MGWVFSINCINDFIFNEKYYYFENNKLCRSYFIYSIWVPTFDFLANNNYKYFYIGCKFVLFNNTLQSKKPKIIFNFYSNSQYPLPKSNEQ